MRKQKEALGIEAVCVPLSLSLGRVSAGNNDISHDSEPLNSTLGTDRWKDTALRHDCRNRSG